MTTIVSRGSLSNRTRKILAWVLVIVAGAEFIARGPERNLHPTNWNDLAQLYAGSRLWLRGKNFSNPENFVALWRDEANSKLDAKTLRTHLAPLPGNVIVLAPIAALPWPAAKLAWLAVLLAAFALTVCSLMRFAGLPLAQPSTLLFIAGCLALAPFHTDIASANETIVVVGICALGIWIASQHRDVSAGLLFGVACSMKPHIGSFIVLYYLVRQRWRLFTTALATTAGLTLIAVAWPYFCGVSWTQDYLHNLRLLAVENRIDDFTSANPIRFMLIDLQVLIYSFTRNASSSNKLALLIGCVLIAAWIYLITRRRFAGSELLALAAIAVIGLLPIYHRFYDASLLAVVLLWCMSEREGAQRNVSTLALLLMAPFLIPGTAVLQQLAGEGRIPASWTDSWWWERLVMPHQTWLLLALSLLLLYALAKSSPRSQPAPAASRSDQHDAN